MKRILVISHNVFCETSNMGKTLLSYFQKWDREALAQFYIHSEVPTNGVCTNYYQVTDRDVLKSIFTRRSGVVYKEQDIQYDREHSRTDTGLVSSIYQKGRKRTPLVYFLRNLLWQLGTWHTPKLRAWLESFKPEAIFFASGDYAFMYKIARKIAEIQKIPLYVCCMDDFYLYNKNADRFGGKMTHRSFMKQVRKTLSGAAGIFTICEKMKDDYFKIFGVPCYTLHTASSFEGPLFCEKKENVISYIGNLGYDRDKQLIVLGKTLKSLNINNIPHAIDVYSQEKRPEILEQMTLENGIRYHGPINSERVKEVMAKSRFLIHTESFADNMRHSVMYSVSTKIADSLASGTCIIAYGPKEVASMAYLAENNAAFCITDDDDIVECFKEMFFDLEKQDAVSKRALALAKRNHSREKADSVIQEIICNANT